MSGTGNPTKTIHASGDQFIDGVLTSKAWANSIIYYAFPTSNTVYDYDTLTAIPDNFLALTTAQRDAVYFALDADAGVSTAKGFSVEGFTNLNIVLDTTPDTTSPEHIRIANTTTTTGIGTSRVADFPNNDATSQIDDNGDVWFGPYNSSIYLTPEAGNFAWHTHLHELGHALGLSHGQSTYEFGALPAQFDSMEYSVMTYRSYVGHSGSGYVNETWGYAQTFMMADIAALQYMYGADYTTNASNTAYKWNPDDGITLINGVAAITPGANLIFATIWDGGGIDTYDLSAYSTDLTLDLRAGGHSVFSTTQLADLGNGHTSRGNIFNALMFDGDTRSLIENAIGGSGSDTITGNEVANTLTGNGGSDRLYGGGGSDQLYGGDGRDILYGKSGYDTLYGGAAKDVLKGNKGNDTIYGNSGADILKGGSGNDTLIGGRDADLLKGNGGNDTLIGKSGNDTLMGGNGDDFLIGKSGDDTLIGGTGSDTFVFQKGAGNDVIKDFEDGIDLIEIENGASNYAALTISDGADGAVITFSNVTIVLENIMMSDLTSDDFLFT